MEQPPSLRTALLLGLSLALGLLAVDPAPARAYTVSSRVTFGCHEELATGALLRMRQRGWLPAIAPDQNERALIDDLPFELDEALRDLAATTLLLGVRDPDLKGRHPGDLEELAVIHGDPAEQYQHCLRSPEQDSDDGAEQALTECRDYIAGLVETALDATLEDGRPDPQHRTLLSVGLDLRGRTAVELPTFYVAAGQALHTLQDAFTHTLRGPDALQVTSVLNWVEFVLGELDDRRDGLPHIAELDRCQSEEPLVLRRTALARLASAELLELLADPALGRDERRARLEALLERYLGFAPGCGYGNGWCNAPEVAFRGTGVLGCGALPGGAGSEPGTGLPGALVGLALLLTGAVARRLRSARRAAVLTLLSLLALAPATARAQAPEFYEQATARAQTRTRLGLHTAFSGAADNAALALTVGLRVRVHPRWLVGFDGEWNPWGSTERTRVRAGTFNAAGVVIHAFPIRTTVSLRTTARVGVSTLLFDLYGAPAGSVGPFFGAVPLGLELKLRRGLYLIIDPLDFAVPIPQVRGVPLIYRQYRITVGLQFGG